MMSIYFKNLFLLSFTRSDTVIFEQNQLTEYHRANLTNFYARLVTADPAARNPTASSQTS